MNESILLALAATLGTWGLTALGAATVVFFRSPNRKMMNLALGFAAGVMIAASFWSLLAPAIERAEAYSSIPAYLVATVGFLFGAIFMWASDKIVTEAQRRADYEDHERGKACAYGGVYSPIY
jgi:ZIP family zinc transporter